MTSIHGVVYIIIGLTVSIVSYYLDYTKMIFFFWLGIIFLIVGLGKLLFKFNKKAKTKKKGTITIDDDALRAQENQQNINNRNQQTNLNNGQTAYPEHIHPGAHRYAPNAQYNQPANPHKPVHQQSTHQYQHNLNQNTVNNQQSNVQHRPQQYNNQQSAQHQRQPHQQAQTNAPYQQQMNNQQHVHQQHPRCPNCGSFISPSNFCHHCGSRLR